MAAAVTPDPDDPRPVPPERPLPGDCCEGGCDPCVFDLHAEAMHTYEAALRAWQARNPGDDGAGC